MHLAHLKQPLLAGLLLSLMLMLTGCGRAESFHYTFPDGYEGFLIIRYDCPNGELLVPDQGKTQIHFQNNGTVCLAGSYTAIHPSGLTIFPIAVTRSGQPVLFKGSSIQGETGYGLVDLQVMVQTEGPTAQGPKTTLSIMWVGPLEHLNGMVKADIYQERLAEFLEQNLGISRKP